MPDRIVDFPYAFKVFSQSIVSIFEIDPVIFLSYLDRIVPLSASLMKLAKKVISTALSVEILGVIYHIQLNCHHSDSRFWLLFLFSLSCRLGPPRESHVAQTYLRYVESFCFYAHLSHILPHVVIFNVSHTVIGFVHIPNSQVKAEIHYRLFYVFLHILKPDKVFHWLSQNNHV